MSGPDRANSPPIRCPRRPISGGIYGAISLNLVMNLLATVLLMKGEVIDYLAGIPPRVEE